MDEKNRLSTRLTHQGRPGGNEVRLVNPAPERGSTVLFPDYETFRSRTKPFYYGRHGTPTHRALEETAGALEDAAHVMLVPSGLAAVNLPVMALARPGAHILVTDSVYDPVRSFCGGLAAQYGIETEFYDPHIGGEIAGKLRENTVLVLTESPGSLTFEIQDLPTISQACRDRGIPVLADNSWGAGVFYRPLALGADISIQAATKYAGGHSDAMSGFIATNDAGLASRIERARKDFGYSVSADEAWLVLRGLRTLKARLAVHEAAGLEMARWLGDRPEVSRVLHPALPSHPEHALWQRDFTGSPGLFSVILNPCTETQVAAFCDALSLFGMGYSWGGFESLCLPIWPEIHRSAVPWQAEGPMLRFHIGLEDITDLQGDLEKAFAAFADAA